MEVHLDSGVEWTDLIESMRSLNDPPSPQLLMEEVDGGEMFTYNWLADWD